MSANQTRVT